MVPMSLRTSSVRFAPTNWEMMTCPAEEKPIASCGSELVRVFEGRGESGTLTISKTPGKPGYACSFTTIEGEIREMGMSANALDAAKLGLEQAAAISRSAEGASQEALSERAGRAREAALSENERAGVRDREIDSPSRTTGRS